MTSSPHSGRSSTRCPSSSRRRSRRSSASGASWRTRSGGSARRSPPASTARPSWISPCARPSTPARPTPAGCSRSTSATSRRCGSSTDPSLLKALEAAEKRAFETEGSGSSGPVRASLGDVACAVRCRCWRAAEGEGDAGDDRGGLDRARGRGLHGRAARAASTTWPARPRSRSRTPTCTRRVQRQAITDELTGLSNVRQLPRAARPGDRARPALQQPPRPGDARHRRLQAGQRHLRPPAGRPGAVGGRAGPARTCRATSTSRRATAARRWR